MGTRSVVRRSLVFAVAAGLGVVVGVQAQPADWWQKARQNSVELRKVGGVSEGTGIVQYDNGSVDQLLSATPPFEFIGNFFDTRNGQPLSPGSISFLSWYQGGIGYSGGGLQRGKQGPVFVAGFGTTTIYPWLTGTSYNASSFAFNAASFTPLAAPQPFIVAIFAEPIGPEGGPPFRGSIGMASGTQNGQGFHARQRSFNGGSSTAISGQNAIVRVGGSVIVPVELMEFDID